MLLKRLEVEDPGLPDAYEQAFVKTVQRLRGVVGVATIPQLLESLRTYEQYSNEFVKALKRGASVEAAWRCGTVPEQAAIEHAFVFVRFHSVLPPDSEQVKALNEWLGTGQPLL
ncbi:MAG: hypothetical protein ABIP38_02085 [Steroidobacteraceae bacterium]